MDKMWLIEHYVINKKSIPDLSEICDKSKSTIRYWLKKYNLLRTRKEGYNLARHKLGNI